MNEILFFRLKLQKQMSLTERGEDGWSTLSHILNKTDE